jgi:hypothetical protein
MLNTLDYIENANQSNFETSSHSIQNDCHQEHKQQ